MEGGSPGTVAFRHSQPEFGLERLNDSKNVSAQFAAVHALNKPSDRKKERVWYQPITYKNTSQFAPPARSGILSPLTATTTTAQAYVGSWAFQAQSQDPTLSRP